MSVRRVMRGERSRPECALGGLFLPANLTYPHLIVVVVVVVLVVVVMVEWVG